MSNTASSSAVTNVLIGCTGSVASLKIPELVRLFYTSETPRFGVKVMATKNARHFFDPKEIPHDVPVLCDADEWTTWTARGDPVLHIELNRWADVMVLAPLDANSMAKIANVLMFNRLYILYRFLIISRQFKSRASAITCCFVPCVRGQLLNRFTFVRQ